MSYTIDLRRRDCTWFLPVPEADRHGTSYDELRLTLRFLPRGWDNYACVVLPPRYVLSFQPVSRVYTKDGVPLVSESHDFGVSGSWECGATFRVRAAGRYSAAALRSLAAALAPRIEGMAALYHNGRLHDLADSIKQLK